MMVMIRMVMMEGYSVKGGNVWKKKSVGEEGKGKGTGR
jgi:hypothetical protein